MNQITFLKKTTELLEEINTLPQSYKQHIFEALLEQNQQPEYRNHTRKKILNYIESKQSPVFAKEITKKFKLATATIFYHLYKLEKQGLISIDSKKGQRIVTTTTDKIPEAQKTKIINQKRQYSLSRKKKDIEDRLFKTLTALSELKSGTVEDVQQKLKTDGYDLDTSVVRGYLTKLFTTNPFVSRKKDSRSFIYVFDQK